MFALWLICILFLKSVPAHVLYINESDYARMPPLIQLDKYDTCLNADNGTGVYCSLKFELVADGPSELYDMIRNYSAITETRFNHSQLFYGICLTKTCNKFYKRNTTSDLALTLEECLNETLWRDYKLKARVNDRYSCETLEDKVPVDTSDIVVGAVVAVLLILNLVGSVHDFYLGNSKKGNGFLNCFAIRQNVRKLLAPTGEGPDPRVTRLKGFYGIKAMTMLLVIVCHSVLPAVIDPDNPRYFEEAYQTYPIMANGTLIVQSFFVVSGFLLLYNMLIDAEKHKPTWFTLVKSIVNRWVRLTPAYMVVLAITSTWLRHFGSGPLWQTVVSDEVESCRRDWWLHPLYVNNYFDNSYCMMHTWYLAADFQLYCLGVLVYVLTKGGCRKTVLGLLFVAGVVMPAVHTYYQDLDGVLMLSPETSRNFLLVSPTFNHTYKRGHTNLASFIIGLATGMAVYHLQNNKTVCQKVAKYRTWFLFSVPSMFAAVLLCNVFYRDGPRASIYVRTLYGGGIKPLFGLGVAMLIIGMVLKFENVYRGVLEWPVWGVPSRISYCAYVLHVMFIRLLNGTRTSTVHISFLHFLEGLSSSITISFITAIPLHLLVEAPFYQLLKLCTSGSMSKSEEHKINGGISLVGQTGKSVP